MLARLLFLLMAVFCDRAHGLHVHERFAAEEVHLAVLPRPALFDEEINGLPPSLRAHDGAVLAIASAVAEAVLAPQVAVLSHHEAERLHEAGLRERRRHIDIRREKLLLRHEFMELAQRLLHILLTIDRRPACQHLRIILPVEGVHEIIDHPVDDMDGAAVHIDENEVTILLELMDSFFHHVLLQKSDLT